MQIDSENVESENAADSIDPDTKDWTWVLDRPCPQCGFDASSVSIESVPAMIRDNAAQWPDVLNRRDSRERSRKDQWSPLEYACHVRDVFRLFDTRLHLMLDEDDPLFSNWDQDETAVAERYGEQDPSTVAGELLAAADTLSRSFESVTEAQRDRPGRRSDGARFTVETFAQYLVHDPVHHLWDVEAA